MALSRSQLSDIEQSLAHLLDFPTDAVEFEEKEAALMTALTEKVDKDHEFFWVGECLRKPYEHFRYLEKQGNTLTVGAIQDAIIQYIMVCLLKPGISLQYWDEKKIRATLPASNWTKKFTAQDMPVENWDFWWSLPVLKDKIYSQAFRIEENDENATMAILYPGMVEIQFPQNEGWLDIDITFANGEVLQKEVFLETLNSQFDNEAAEDEYMEEVLEQAAIRARAIAAKEAIRYLLKNNIALKQQHVTSVLANKAAQEVITQQFWFDMLLQDKLQFAYLCNLSDNAATTLTCPAIINLCQKEILDFATAKKLQPYIVTLLRHPVFFPLMESKEINIESLLEISKKRAQWLIHSYVPNLIQCHKISFKQASTQPWHLRQLFENDGWLTWFKTHHVNWHVFNTLPVKAVDSLLQPGLMRLLSNNVITMQEVLDLMKECQYMTQPFSYIMVRAFAKRLYGFCDHINYLIDGHWDNMDLVQSEIAAAANLCNTSLDSFKEWIFSDLLDFLLDNFNQKIEELMENDARIAVYNTFIDIILDDQNSNDKLNWTHVFENLANHAMTIQQGIHFVDFFSKHDNSTVTDKIQSLFSRKRKKPCEDTDIRDICEGLITIAPLCKNSHTSRESYSMLAI